MPGSTFDFTAGFPQSAPNYVPAEASLASFRPTTQEGNRSTDRSKQAHVGIGVHGSAGKPRMFEQKPFITPDLALQRGTSSKTVRGAGQLKWRSGASRARRRKAEEVFGVSGTSMRDSTRDVYASGEIGGRMDSEGSSTYKLMTPVRR